MDNQGEMREIPLSSIPEDQLKVPQASQVTELRTKINRKTATDQDKIALAFALKEKFKKDFGRVSEQEAILLQEIVQKDNVLDIIHNFNSVTTELNDINDPITRGLVLELLNYGVKGDAIKEIYKTANWGGATENDKNLMATKLADFFTTDNTDKSRDYAKGAAMIKFIPKLDFDSKINYAKMAFENAPTAEIRYNWYTFIDESLKKEGKRFEALQFFKENKEFLFKEKIKAAEKAKPIIASRFSDLSKPEAREELAWVLNKVFKPKNTIVGEDIRESSLITKEVMVDNLGKISQALTDEELGKASGNLLKFGIPILMPSGSLKFLVDSEQIAGKLDIKTIQDIAGITKRTSRVPLYEDLGGIFVMTKKEAWSASLHESMHINRYIFRPTSNNLIAEASEHILTELDAFYIDGTIPLNIRAGQYEDFRLDIFKNYIAPTSEFFEEPAKKESFLVDALGSTSTIKYLHDVGLSAVDVQDILLNSRTLKDFNEWIKYPKEDLKQLFKVENVLPRKDFLEDILKKYSARGDATFIEFPIDVEMQGELAGYLGKTNEEFLEKYNIPYDVYRQLLVSMWISGKNPMIEFLQLYKSKVYWQEHSEKPGNDIAKELGNDPQMIRASAEQDWFDALSGKTVVGLDPELEKAIKDLKTDMRTKITGNPDKFQKDLEELGRRFLKNRGVL